MRFLPALSFRWKLVLAMMLVVAGVAGVTLSLTQKRVSATYQKLFEEQFRSQIAYFTREQELRLESVMDRCSELCGSVRVIGAMNTVNEEPGSEAAEIIYDIVRDELRQTLKLDRPQLNHPPAGPAARHLPRVANSPAARTAAQRIASLAQVMIRVVDTNGVVLADPQVPGIRGERDAGRRLDWFLVHTVAELKHQDVGYLAIDGTARGSMLREVVVTPIVDRAQSNVPTIGALIIGFPLVNMGERQLSDMSSIRTGILLDGRLYSRTIPEDKIEFLAARVTEEMKMSQTPRADFIIRMDGQPFRVFYTALNPDSPFPTAYQVGLYSLAAAELEKLELRWKILSGSALVMLGALVLSLLLSHGLSVPIRELVRGTNEIQQGNFAVKVPVRSRDELGQLAASFNEMAGGLAQKEKYRSVLDMVADKGVAEELINGTVALGGEQREISVLFCDIRGFTALTQNMPPTEVIAMLNEHMTALTRVVYEHDGVVDKFVGDLIMAVFGAPKSYGNDAYNAARCALRMIEERAKLNETSQHKILMGIGVATGPAVAGCMGSADRLNYTVLGERVNLASRLCGVAGKMEVVIDQTTREKLGPVAEVERTEDLLLKGFSDRVPAFKLTTLHSFPETGKDPA
jgi:class 3 adenylate cyclase